MRVSILLVSVGLVITAAPLQANQSQRSVARSRAAAEPDRVTVDGEIRVLFSTRELELIRQHYAPRRKDLPPGLRKKLARTGQLPPGWQRKVESFPVALERQLSPLPAGYARGIIEGNAVIYVPGTSVIVDASVLF